MTDPAIATAVDAAFPGLPQGMTLDEAERRVTAAIVAFLKCKGLAPVST